MKFSKDLLELRDKEAKLVRMKRYEEAEKVKMKADLLEEFERNKLEAEVSRIAFLVSLIKTNSKSQTLFKFESLAAFSSAFEINSNCGIGIRWNELNYRPLSLFSFIDVSRYSKERGQATTSVATSTRRAS